MIENILRKANKHLNAGEFSKAEDLYNSALTKFPKNLRINKALKNLKLIQNSKSPQNSPQDVLNDLIRLHSLGFYQDLINKGLVLLRKYPRCYFLNNMIGAGYVGLKIYDKAVEYYLNAISLNSDNAINYYNLGIIYKKLQNLDLSIKFFKIAIDKKNNFFEAYNDLANIYKLNGFFEESMAYYKEAIRINPKFSDAYVNLANLYKENGADSVAKKLYIKSLEINSLHYEASLNLSLIFLNEGNFNDGWVGYRKKWNVKQFNSKKFDIKKPIFDLSSNHRHVFVWKEQGIGDQILFSRLFNDLRDKDIKIDALVDKKLKPLFQSSFPHINFVDSANEEGIDSHAPMGDLGRFFINNFDDVKARSHPFIKVNQQRTESLKKLLPSDKKICGISWVSVNEDLGRDKSMSLEQLKDILLLPNMVFVDLQYGDTSHERQSFYEKYGVKILKIEEVDNFDDIEGLASLIDLCDCVLSVSNTTVHIAGAIGKPTYLMLPKGKGKLWYWSKQGTQSIWYKSIQIFEQNKIGEWNEVVKKCYNSMRTNYDNE